MDRKDPQMLPFCGSKSTASFQAARLSWKGSNLQWTWINCQVVWSHGWLDGYSKTLKKLSRWNEVKKKRIIKIHHLLPPNKRLEPEFTSLKGRFIFQTFIFGFQPFVFGGVVGRVRSLRRLTSKAPEGRCNFGGLFPRADWNCSFQWWHVYIYIHIYPRSKDFLWNCWKKLRWTSSFFLLIDKDNPLQSLQQWNPETNIRFFGAMKILCPQLRYEVKLKTWKMRINE